MESETKELHSQLLSVRDTERKYGEAIAQLNSLQNIHKHTLENFEKEKVIFKA
jgi:hypothetical protein